MASTVTFLKQMLSDPGQIGAIAPSSRALADYLVVAAGTANAKTIVEFGPGTGVITQSIIKRKRQDALFLAMEINEELAAEMKAKYPREAIIHDSAVNTRQHLEERGRSSCDCIISGLPWTVFDDDLQDALLNTIVDILEPGGRFVTFAYVQSPWLPQGKKFQRKLHARFQTVQKMPVVWANLPPAFAYLALGRGAS